LGTALTRRDEYRLEVLSGGSRRLPKGELWRHNVAGDLPGHGGTINTRMLAELVEANRGKRGFTYSHKHASRENLAAIGEANRQGFTINLSANTLKEADQLARKNAGPVVVILGSNAARSTVDQTPEGRKVIVCPESYQQGIQCISCGLCADPNRTAIIGFPAHGAAFRKAELVTLGRN